MNEFEDTYLDQDDSLAHLDFSGVNAARPRQSPVSFVLFCPHCELVFIPPSFPIDLTSGLVYCPICQKPTGQHFEGPWRVGKN